MPLQDAAAKLKLSTSTLNRSAKQLGLSAWPYRRVSCDDDNRFLTTNHLQFRSLKNSINVVSLKLQRCIENGNHGDKEAAHRAELHRLHAKLLALRNNPTQVNHVVWRTNNARQSKAAGSASNVAEGLELSIEPRSFEHALESLLFILQRHMPTGNRPALNSPPLFIPAVAARPSTSSLAPNDEQSPRTPVAHQQLGAVVMRAIHSGDSRSAFKRVQPTPTLSSAMAALEPPAAKRRPAQPQRKTTTTTDSQS